MTTEEKLNHFYEFTIKNAYEKSNITITEYKEALEEKFEDHKIAKLKQAEVDILNEKDIIKRENNDKYSHANQFIKKELIKKNQEFTDNIFQELIKLLNNYKKTKDYQNMLIKQINNIRMYAKWGEEQIIYLEPSDIDLKEELEKETNCTLTMAEDSFIGGIKAVVNKNILIDNSFLSKIEELRENFNIHKLNESYLSKNIHHGGSING